MRFSPPYWLRILLANTAGALAVVGISGGFSASWGAFSRGLGVSMVYANAIGTLAALVAPDSSSGSTAA